ncbi:MAG: UDP-2,3-diacylglucosamine diphosphatase [Luteibaculaceae bacterium]
MGSTKNCIYFLSDFHLGVPNKEKSLAREKEIVAFLRWAEPTAKEIFLVGDIFDFWFEYKTAIPKGYTRFLGELARLSDAGIKISVFTGNHDMWMFGYLSDEVGATLYKNPQDFNFQGKQIHIAHGDGLGPGDNGYKIIKKVFANPICQWAFRWIHPDLGIRLANYFSRSSRAATGNADDSWFGEENEWLVSYCKDELTKKKVDFFIFGHRHLPIDFTFENGSKYLNLGDWIRYKTFAKLENGNLELMQWKEGAPLASKGFNLKS